MKNIFGALVLCVTIAGCQHSRHNVGTSTHPDSEVKRGVATQNARFAEYVGTDTSCRSVTLSLTEV
jgi:hypothetical protein